MNGKMLIVAAAALLLAGAGPADAGTRKHKPKRLPPAPVAYVPALPSVYPAPRPVWAAPQECFTDEGYGRFWPCGAGRP